MKEEGDYYITPEFKKTPHPTPIKNMKFLAVLFLALLAVCSTQASVLMHFYIIINRILTVKKFQ